MVKVDDAGYEEKLVSNSIQTINDMLKSCPNPTREELVKLLAVQGHYLQQVGLEMLAEAQVGTKGREKKVLVALKALTHSRQALEGSLTHMGKD